MDVVCILTIIYREITNLEKMGLPTNDLGVVFIGLLYTHTFIPNSLHESYPHLSISVSSQQR